MLLLCFLTFFHLPVRTGCRKCPAQSGLIPCLPCPRTCSPRQDKTCLGQWSRPRMHCSVCDVDDMFMPTAPYLAGGDILCHLPPWPGGPTNFAGVTIQVGDDILCRRPPLASTYYAEFPTYYRRVRPLPCSGGPIGRWHTMPIRSLI